MRLRSACFYGRQTTPNGLRLVAAPSPGVGTPRLAEKPWCERRLTQRMPLLLDWEAFERFRKRARRLSWLDWLPPHQLWPGPMLRNGA